MSSWQDKARKVGSQTGGVVASAVGDAVRGAGRPDEANFDTMLANAFQGMTFGAGDEIVAGARDLLGIEDYDSALRNHRALVKEGQAASPVGAAIANLAGGVLIPGFGIAKAAAAPTLARQALGLAGIGAATGGVTGFASGEGGAGNRLKSAGIGAAVGAAAVPGLVGLGNLAAKGARMLGNITGLRSEAGLDAAAGNKVLQALERSGYGPDDAAKALDDLSAAGVKGASLADLGENTQQLTAAAARIPGKGAEMAGDFAATRQAGQGGRLVGAFEDALGTDKRLAPFLSDLTTQQQVAARPLYAAADAVEVPTSPLAPFLKDDTFRKALNRGLKIVALEEGPDAVPKVNFDDVLNTLPAKMPTRWLDLAKRGLDADILASKVSDPTYSRALVAFKRRFLSTLDTLNPTYAKARAAWAGHADLADAAELGRKALSMNPDDLAAVVKGLNSSTRDAFRVGILDNVKDLIQRAPDAADKVKRVFGSERMRDLLSRVFTPQEYARLDSILSAERQMFKTLVEIGGNSKTALRQAADADFKVEAAPVIPATWKGVAGALLKQAEGYAKGYNERIATGVLERMTATDKLQIERILEALKALKLSNQVKAANPLRGAPSYAIGLGGVTVPGLLSQ